ncbi:MAG: asparagine synthase (glutamine-hydrolyzing) [Planctomycetota bacterium]|jgi:asparagine synthase (glutamine-hydrolysing)
MCGITGLIWKDAHRPADRKAVRTMTDVLTHRGPDDAGYHAHGPVALGHRRLSILDLSDAGHQPMISRDGRHVIVHNGEVYNYIELRDELERRGCSFRSRTDTEVILEAYRTWGPDCVKRFNGMWAFAIHDSREETIFLSRDRFGIKPLYYLDRSDCFAFASEIKGILSVFPDERRPDPAAILHFLPSGMLDDGPETFFQNVRSLLPAHSALYRIATGEVRIWRYWDADYEKCRERWEADDPVETMWELLNSSVRLRLRSDVPVGTCLSGGVDSSTIVGVMSSMHPEPVRTFSGLYPDRDCDESEYIDAVNRHTGSIACPVFPEPKDDLIDVLDTITWHQDRPTAGPGLITQFHVMQRARGEVKVILDGQGGDELLAGYLPYFAQRTRDLLRNGSAGNLPRVAYLVGQVARHWGRRWAANTAAPLLGAPLTGLGKRAAAALRGEPPLFHPALAEYADDNRIVRSCPAKMPTALGNTLYWQLTRQSIPALLHYEDRNSMAHSIEARVPLLDHRIVEFALGLDDRHKIHDTWTKWVLRRSAERVVPPAVAWRRSKLGYPTPFARWLREDPGRRLVGDLIFSGSFQEREIVREDSLRYWWKRHQSGRADRSWFLYRCATLELWYRRFIDEWNPRPARPTARATA